MGRSKLKALKETTLNTFFELTSNPTPESIKNGEIRLGITNQYSYNAQSGIITWGNGSEIILKDLFLYPSDPNFDSLGSLEITGAFIDECNQVTHKAWTVVKSRIRFKLREYDIIPKLMGTCNPSKNWVYKLFYRPGKESNLPIYRKFIQSLPKDNPHLPESYIESLSQMDEVSKQRLLLGNWEYDDDKAALISYTAIMDYWNGSHVQEGTVLYLTIDVARKGKDKTVFRVWKGWVVVYRCEMAVSKVDEVVNKAKQLQIQYGIYNSNTIADEDGVGGGVVDYLGCIGFVNNSKALNGENYTNLKSQCSIKMAKRIEERTVCEMSDDQKVIDSTTEEMEQVKLKDIDKDGKMNIIPKDEVKALIGRSPDDWDTIMMRERFEFGTGQVLAF